MVVLSVAVLRRLPIFLRSRARTFSLTFFFSSTFFALRYANTFLEGLNDAF